ncbi:MAG: VWA domain-containing protein [Acidobacteriota bacterium]
MRLRLLALAALLLVGAADRPKQQPQAPLPTLGETIEVSIVNVDVFVTDKAGNRVRGLTPADFDVFENGAKQPITNFAEYANSTVPPLPLAGEGARRAGEGTPAPPTDQKRTLVVFVERFRLPKVKSDPLFDSMKKLLHGTVRPGDAAMVVTWNRGELKTLQSYTDDLALIDRAIDSLAQQNTSALRDEFAQARQEGEDIQDFELQVQEFTGALLGDEAAGSARENYEEMLGGSQRMDALRARAEMEQKILTINALMRSMAGFDGKRVLLMATHRLSQVAGAEFFWAAGVGATLDSLDRLEFDTTRMVRSLYETANANGVTIYPMFPEGLGSTGPSVRVAGQRIESNAAAGFEYLIQDNETPTLKVVAQQTGGIPAWGSSNVPKLLETVRDDFETYYSLAYRTTPRSLDKTRSIVVKMKDTKRGLVVRSRRGVTEKSDVTRMEDKVLASLFRPGDEGARLKFGVKVGEKQPRGKQYRIPITIRIPIAALTMLPNGPNYSGGFSVYIAWGSKVGGISDASHQRQLFHIPAGDVQRAKRSFYTYQFDIAADARTERLSLGVVDEVSKEYGLRVYELH